MNCNTIYECVRTGQIGSREEYNEMLHVRILIQIVKVEVRIVCVPKFDDDLSDDQRSPIKLK